MHFTFSELISRFFTSYLVDERALSSNTVATYSDCMRLLIQYACSRLNIQPEELSMDMINPDLILDFLDHLETDRDNSESTRNERLAAIKAFFHFLARTVPELMGVNERIQAIRRKAVEHKPPPSLTVQEIDALISTVQSTTLLGVRDKAILQLMYNTGARVQEIVELTISDLRLESPPMVTLTGKGRKQRSIPLWPQTVEMIRHYVRLREEAGVQSSRLFLNNKNQPITRHGIRRRIKKHAANAALPCPSLQGRNVTPHVLRHTTALHLIEADLDLPLVRDWLGHTDMKTTSQYVEVNIQRKRAALDKVPPPTDNTEPESPTWTQPQIMTFLYSLSRKSNYVAKGQAKEPTGN